MAAPYKRVEDQYAICVCKAPAGKKDPYTIRNIDAEKYMCHVLKTATARCLWYALSANADKYTFVLSPTEIQNDWNIKKDAFYRARDLLKANGFLQYDAEADLWFFVEWPQHTKIPQNEDSVVQKWIKKNVADKTRKETMREVHSQNEKVVEKGHSQNAKVHSQNAKVHSQNAKVHSQNAYTNIKDNTYNTYNTPENSKDFSGATNDFDLPYDDKEMNQRSVAPSEETATPGTDVQFTLYHNRRDTEPEIAENVRSNIERYMNGDNGKEMVDRYFRYFFHDIGESNPEGLQHNQRVYKDNKEYIDKMFGRSA